MRLPSLGAVEAFAAVARTGSAKRAAESLALSPSALSRRLQALETYVGHPLFERRHQSLVLTREGETLANALAPILDDLRRVFEAHVGHGDLRLHLGVMPLYASHLLIPRLPDLKAAHPELHLELDTGPTPLARLGEGLDAAIWLARKIDSRFYSRQIGKAKIVAVASKELVESGKAPKRPEDLLQHTLLVHRDMPQILEHWLDKLNLPPMKPAEMILFDSGQLILDSAASGLGIGLILDLLAKDDDRLVPLFDLDVDSPYNYWFVCRRPALAERPVKLFHNWLFQEFKA